MIYHLWKKGELVGAMNSIKAAEAMVANGLADNHCDGCPDVDKIMDEFVNRFQRDDGGNGGDAGCSDNDTAGVGSEHDAMNRLRQFKNWVHNWLDDMGVPYDPDPERTQRTGCRVGPRLDWLFVARTPRATDEVSSRGSDAAQVVNQYGAKRGTDLIGVPYHMLSRHALRAYAEAMAEGSRMYGHWNWLRGFPISGLIDHAVEHLLSFTNGDQNGEDHLGHALWNVATAIEFMKTRPELNDIPNKERRDGFASNKHEHKSKDGDSPAGGGGSFAAGASVRTDSIR